MVKGNVRAGTDAKSVHRQVPGADDVCITADVDDSVAQQAKADRCRMIAEAAYYLAEARNFTPGHEIEDWLQAEKNIDAARASVTEN